MALEAGQKAPDFKLVDINKQEVTLSQFKGKNVVLFFFPMAWTGTCTRQMCTISEDYSAYEQLDAVPIGISVDTLFALKRYGEDYKLGLMLLSDFNKQATKDYGVMHHDFNWGYKDVSKRATFIIDREGIIRFIEILPALGDFPNLEAIKKVLAVLK